MTQGKYMELSVAQRTDVWRRWKVGESLHTIGRAVERPHTSIHWLLAHHGGIVPAVRKIALRLNQHPRKTLGFRLLRENCAQVLHRPVEPARLPGVTQGYGAL